MSLLIRKTAQLTGHTGAVYALENSPERNNFYSGGSDGIVAEWDLTSPDTGEPLAKVNNVIYSLKLIAAKKLLLIGQDAGGIHVIDLATRKEIRLLQFHTAAVFDLNYAAQHDLLFSAAGNGTLAITGLTDFAAIKSIKLGTEKLRNIAISNSQTEVAIGCGDGSIAVFDLPALTLKKRWMAHRESFSVNALHYSADDSILFSGSRDAHMNIFDAKNNFSLVKSIPAHNYAIYSIVFSGDKKYFATASRDKTIKIWDADSLEILARLDKEKQDGHLNSVNKLLWKDENLISASDDRSLIVWNVSSILE